MAHGSESYWNTLVGTALLAAGTLLVEFVRMA